MRASNVPALVATCLLTASGVTSVALPDRDLIRRDLRYTTGTLSGLEAFPCHLDDRPLINKQLEDAKLLADLARKVTPAHPAYRAFIDRSVPSDSMAELSEDQLKLYNLVNERFEQAYAQLADTDKQKPYIRIACGKLVADSAKNGVCKSGVKSYTHNPDTGGTPTIVICPNFLQRILSVPHGTFQTRPQLGTVVERPDHKDTMNICENPEQLQYASNPAKTLLHEVMKLHYVSPPDQEGNGKDTSVIDCVYGGYLSGYLAQMSPETAFINADNYAYMALSAYMNANCHQPGTMFYQKEVAPDRHTRLRMPMANADRFERCKLPQEVAAAVGLPTKANDPAWGTEAMFLPVDN